MDTSTYFALMRETSDLAYPLLVAQIDSIRGINADLHGALRFIIDRRNNQHTLLKPFLLRLTYELCGGTDWKRTVPIGAAFELLNISSYQANSAFDNKYGVLTLNEKNSQFIASMVTREACLDLLGTARSEFGGDTVTAIAEQISACNKHIYFAQHYDLNVLTTANLARYEDERVYFEDYTKRCRYGSGVFTGHCARAGGALARGSSDVLAAIQLFGEEFGTGIQVMNDLADFVPAGVDGLVGRGFQDQFSDIRNGRLTLGCYKLYRETSSEGRELFKRLAAGGKLSEAELRDFVGIMVKAGVVASVKRHAATHARKAKLALRHFPSCQAKDCLSLMATVCYRNKFTKALERCG